MTAALLADDIFLTEEEELTTAPRRTQQHTTRRARLKPVPVPETESVSYEHTYEEDDFTTLARYHVPQQLTRPDALIVDYMGVINDHHNSSQKQWLSFLKQCVQSGIDVTIVYSLAGSSIHDPSALTDWMLKLGCATRVVHHRVNGRSQSGVSCNHIEAIAQAHGHHACDCLYVTSDPVTLMNAMQLGCTTQLIDDLGCTLKTVRELMLG